MIMFNVLIDELPEEYEGYKINTDHRTGIMISQAVEDPEISDIERARICTELLFGNDAGEALPDAQTAFRGISWFLSGWYTDGAAHALSIAGKKETKDTRKPPVLDYDRDQWRIYTAFLAQYRIDLNRETLHYWVFMALLSNLQECALTQVIDIRQKPVEGTPEQKRRICEAKAKYGLEDKVTAQDMKEEAKRQAIAADFMKRVTLHKA